jgi:phospholipid/cholesterol/gamma-HCH transport system substrate-binding protein
MTGTKLRRRLVGVGFLAVLALLISLAVAVYNQTFTSDTMVTLYTDSTGNEMNIHADVMVRGVVIGQVRSISSDGTGAVLTLAINPDTASTLPANVMAEMLPTTLFGERYVDLMLPAKPATQTLAETKTIGQDHSVDAIELEQVLNDLYPMLTAIQPQKLSVTLTSIADALQGRGPELGQTLDDINSYLKQFDTQLPALDNDIRELVGVTQTYSQASPGIIQALHSFATTGQTIVSEASTLDSLYSTVTSASQNLTTFLDQNQQDIIGLSTDSQGTLETLARYSSEFPCVLSQLTTFAANMNKVLGAGTNRPGIAVTVHPVQSRGKYLPYTNTPRYGDDLGPHCYATPFAGIPLNDGASPPTTRGGATSSSQDLTASVPAAGLGLANSPSENELINELVAPGVNVAPDNLPSWSSVLVGPIFRGTTVTIK